MPIRLAVFDIAGTVIADGDAVSRAFVSAFAKFDLHIETERVRPLMGYKKTAAIEFVLRQLNIDATAAMITGIHDAFERNMIDFYRSSDDVQPMRSAERVIRELRQNGIKVALNTGFPRSIAQTIIDRFNWHAPDFINSFIASDEVEAGRPDPAMIFKLMESTGISNAAEVLKVGDTEVDIREGKNAGCGLVVAVTTGAFTREQLEPYKPDHIVDDLAELTTIIRSFA